MANRRSELISMSATASPIERINALIQSGENSSTEFKSNYCGDDVSTLVGFANGYDGVPTGTMLVGINDAGDIIGIHGNPDSIQKKIADDCRVRCEPPIFPRIHVVKIGHKEIVVIDVARSQMRPHRADGICYVRGGLQPAKQRWKRSNELEKKLFGDHSMT